MTKIRIFLSTLLAILAFASFQVASAATITSSLGNTASGLVDGSTPAGFMLGGIQSGQPAPFNAACGSDAVGPNCSASWSHVYGAIADPILSASLSIGIVDHDSAAEGNQLASFSLDGSDFVTPMGALFEGSGGGDGEYNVYTLDLLGAGLSTADLADGLLMVALGLGGPGQTTCTLAFACPEEPVVPVVLASLFNGANLIFSTLAIETRDGPLPVIPIPAAAPLFASALVLFGLYRRRIQRKDV